LISKGNPHKLIIKSSIIISSKKIFFKKIQKYREKNFFQKFITLPGELQCWLAQSQSTCQADTLPSLGTKKLHQGLFQILTDFCHTGYTQVELTNPYLEISPPSLTKAS
jgi:hypothetical protein